MLNYFELLKHINESNYKAFEVECGFLECFDTTDYVAVFLGGEHLGNIFKNEGDWELIAGGENPIENHWEDGCGNTLSYDGWGKDF